MIINNRELESGLTGEECLEQENRVAEASTQLLYHQNEKAVASGTQ
jgi:hypothetical protein